MKIHISVCSIYIYIHIGIQTPYFYRRNQRCARTEWSWFVQCQNRHIDCLFCGATADVSNVFASLKRCTQAHRLANSLAALAHAVFHRLYTECFLLPASPRWRLQSISRLHHPHGEPPEQTIIDQTNPSLLEVISIAKRPSSSWNFTIHPNCRHTKIYIYIYIIHSHRKTKETRCFHGVSCIISKFDCFFSIYCPGLL